MINFVLYPYHSCTSDIALIQMYWHWLLYLQELIQEYKPARTLRSSPKLNLVSTRV